jgi:hypothetical protein
MVKILIDNHKVLSIVQSPLGGTLFQFSTSPKNKDRREERQKKHDHFDLENNGPHEIEPIFQLSL